LDNVDMFIVQTEFQRQKFIAQGIPAEQLGILPGIMPQIAPAGDWLAGKFVTFIGRVSPEKGIDEFLAAARLLPEIPFRVAGAYDGMPGIREQSPANVEWLGFLKGDALRQAYLDSRLVVVPSKWYEGFPNVIVMGMMLERPIVTADLGATGSIIDAGRTGDKFAPGNASDLAQKIRALYADIPLCHQYGETGHQEATALYSREQIYAKLMEIIDAACRRAHPDTP
jgi:glycosyltransferase involved in cell wall biosynthesis